LKSKYLRVKGRDSVQSYESLHPDPGDSWVKRTTMVLTFMKLGVQ
jgi:hypothetical protein